MSSQPADSSARADLTASPPTELELFVAFAKMSVAGFGGVLVWARRAVVDQHRWMTQDQFNEVFALCHFLPGPNIVNLAVVFGGRLRGIPGSLAAFSGLIGPPMVLFIVLAALYDRYGEIPALQRTLAGVSCAAVGLFISVIFRMMIPLLKRREPVALGLLVASFIAVGLGRIPLVWVLLVGVPVAVGLTYAMQRRSDA